MKPSAPTDRWYAGSRPAQLIEPTFGLTLHELVKPVIGFRITTSDGEVTQLVNISHEADTASVSQDKYHNKRDSAVFLLAAGEFVKSLCFFKDEARLTALCFVTNLRKSRWFGHPAPDDRYGSISAPEGQYIHALYGEEQGTACENVGVVKWKLSASHVEPCSNPLTTPQSGGAFHSHALDLRAIVVRCDVLVKSITVLSRAEYRRVLTVGWDVQYHADEHILELFGGEKITGVEWTCDQEHMQALRLHTSHRTSAWFGGCGAEPTTVIRAAEDAFIIGFKGHKDDEAVTELYAIQYSEKGQGERSDRQVQESVDVMEEEGASSVTTKGSMTEDEEVQPSWELLVELSGH